MIFIYCPKRDHRLAVLVCEAQGCSHLRRDEEQYLCRFISKKDRVVRKRKKLRRKEGVNEGLGL